MSKDYEKYRKEYVDVLKEIPKVEEKLKGIIDLKPKAKEISKLQLKEISELEARLIGLKRRACRLEIMMQCEE